MTDNEQDLLWEHKESKEVRTDDNKVLADGLFRQWYAMPTMETPSCDTQTDRVVYLPGTIIPDKGSKREKQQAHRLV